MAKTDLNEKQSGEKQENNQELLKNAFANLSTNIQMLTANNPIQSLMITSTMPHEGNRFVSRQLTFQFANNNLDVLLIQTESIANKKSSQPQVGVMSLINHLLSEKIKTGNISKYGLIDLFYLIYLQEKSGQLILRTQAGIAYFADFKDGILCSFKTPTIDLKHDLHFLEKTNNPNTKNLIDSSREKQVPLINLVLSTNSMTKSELSLLYTCELIKIYRELSQEDLFDFDFKVADNAEFKPSAQLLDKFVLESEPLQDQNFISKTIQKNINPINKKCSLMLLGSPTHNLSQSPLFNNLKKLMPIFKKQFDRIILEAPSFKTNKETNAMGTLTDGTILVIRQNHAKKHKIKKAVRKLLDADIKILGTVFNQS